MPNITEHRPPEATATTPRAPVERAGVFYGWRVVGGVFVTLLVTAGLGFYNASVILQAAKEELDTSVTAVSGATALFFGVSGIAAFVFAPRMDRVDLRWFYVSGGVVGAVALVGLRLVESVAALYVFFAVFGIGFALAGLVPGTTVVARWFNVRRSIALSIATTGLSVGGIVITPLAAALIDRRTLGGAGPILAAAWLIGVIPVALLTIRSSPAELGLEPDGLPAPPATPAGETAPPMGATFHQAIGTRFFVFTAATYALVFTAQVGALAQLFNLASERIDRGTAAAALSTLAFASVAGRLLGGFVVTLVPIKRLTGALVVVQAVALAMIAMADSRPALLGACVVFGLSVGNLLMLQPLLLADAFGVAEYSRIYSFSQLIGTIGVAGGPFVIGVLRDVSSYRTAFLVGSAANLVAVATLVAAGSVAVARLTWSPEPFTGDVA